MTHSPETWTYDEGQQAIRDACGRIILYVTPAEYVGTARERAHANGHYIAALSVEVAECFRIATEAVPDLEGQPDRNTAVRRVVALATRYENERETSAILRAENARLREALQRAVAAMQGALGSWEDTHDVDQDGDRLIERSDVDSLEMCRIAVAIERSRAALAAQEAQR